MKNMLKTSIAALALSLALTINVQMTRAEVLTVTLHGSVAQNDLNRGPYEGVKFGAPVDITFSIDTDEDIGVETLHRYWCPDYQIEIDGIPMTASADVTFGFATFPTFHGFDNTSTGLLSPGGGGSHNYRIPVFGGSGPPTIWLPEGSTPDEHQVVTDAEAFDFFNDNELVDQGAGGPGVDLTLDIAFEWMQIGPPPFCYDLDGDQWVSFTDLLILLGDWGECAGSCNADYNEDGVVDFSDLLLLLAFWGPCE